MSCSVSIRITSLYSSTTLWRKQGFSAVNRRAQIHFPDPRAPFQEQLQLAHRQLQAPSLTPAPQAGKSSLFQPLAVDAQPGPVPQQHLGSPAIAVDEQV